MSTIIEHVLQPSRGYNCYASDGNFVNNVSAQTYYTQNPKWQHNGNDMLPGPISMCGSIFWDGSPPPNASTDSDQFKERYPLADAVVFGGVGGTDFAANCVTNSNDTSATRQSFCPLNCVYDPSKFKTLEQIYAWQQKYGMYPKDEDNTKYINATDSTVLNDNSTGVVSATADISSNYDTIMQHFCSQRHTKCFEDPYSVMCDPNTEKGCTGPKLATKCSYLKSDSPEGQACRFWLDSHGPNKYIHMQQIGINYCKSDAEDNSDSPDCRCVLRDNDPNFPSVSKTMNASVKTNPGCFYIPCSDPTNYIIGTDIMGTLHSTDDGGSSGDSGAAASTSSYGVTCGDTVCQTIVNIQNGDSADIKNNSLYIQCGSNNDGGGGGTKTFGQKLSYGLSHPKEDPLHFVLALLLYIILPLIGVIAVLAIIRKLLVSSSSQPQPQPQH